MKKWIAWTLGIFSLAAVGCGKDNGNGSESSEAKTETSVFTVTAAYDYGTHIQNQLTLLYGGSFRFFDLPENYGEVLAGDTFSIEHTGEAYVLDIYPSRVSISGEIVSVTAQRAERVGLTCEVSESSELEFFLYEGGCIVGEKVKIEACPKYYLTNENGEIGYEELTTAADGMAFYGTYSPVNGYDETDGYTLSGLYAWNPQGE